MIMSFDCEPFRYHFAELSDYRLWNSAGTGAVRPREVLLEGPPWRVTVVMPERMKPGEWTCVEHVQSGMEWCGGFLPGDVDQNRLVTARDINALIDSMNLVPGRVLPPYATDIDRSGLTTPADILRLIDLLNGTEDFDTWMTRNLPPCPSKP